MQTFRFNLTEFILIGESECSVKKLKQEVLLDQRCLHLVKWSIKAVSYLPVVCHSHAQRNFSVCQIEPILARINHLKRPFASWISSASSQT